MRIYTVNLAPAVTEDELREAFRVFGQVSFVKITQEQVQDALVCSGMVGMPIRLEAKAAIAGLHGKVLKGNVITVNEVGVRSR
jgi:RNA recognition motif-containing protein